MRIFLFFVLLFCLCTGGLLYRHRHKATDVKVDPNVPFVKNHPAYLQAKTSHMLEFVGSDGNAYCTGTAVGPHAILTAEHCHLKINSEEILRIDNSQEKYRITEQINDKHEHVIMFISGLPFTEIEPLNTRVPKVGEKTYVYGFGREIYPAVVKMGIVLDEYDPSEVDRRLGLFYTSNNAIPGDSGAVVYGEDGSMLGLVTYRLTNGKDNFGHTGSFQLAFTPEQIKKAQGLRCGMGHKRPRKHGTHGWSYPHLAPLTGC